MEEQDTMATLNNDQLQLAMIHQRIENILLLNDDCLITIMQELQPIDLCNAAETCQRLQIIAREAFKLQYVKDYSIPQYEIKLIDHSRILRNFGDLISKVKIMSFLQLTMNEEELVLVFNWLDRYCHDTLSSMVFFVFGPPYELP